MKVKMLRDGRWAHEDVSRGQFDHLTGDIISGICESDAIKMKNAGAAEVLGEDCVEAVEEVEDEEVTEAAEEEVKEESAKPWGR